MPDDRALSKLRVCCEKELLLAQQPRHTFAYGELTIKDDTASLCGLRFKSASLCAHLQGCTHAYLFAATLGAGVDRLISRYSAESMSKAYCTDRLASTRIEAYCDEVQTRLLTNGLFLRPRFSPGYGDFSLECQGELLRALDAQRGIGLFCTEGGMLTPLKSVTAVIGLSAQINTCNILKCAACAKRDCAFRFGGKEGM